MRKARLVAACWLAALGGCDLAPAYRPPRPMVPDGYQGSRQWPVAAPRDRYLPGAWWTMFRNPTLDALEPLVRADNPDLAASVASLEQARDLIVEAGYGLFPTVGLNGGLSADRQSAHRPLRRGGPDNYADNVLNVAARWQLDLWGQLRNAIKAQNKLTQASAANVAGVTLALQAELAHDVVMLRAIDQETAIYRGAIRYYENGVRITELRLAHQIASALDVDQARNQLATAQARLAELSGRREVTVHAIALLLGRNPSVSSLPPQDGVPMALPAIPVGLPSTLLQRRPDIAAAEREMAAANAEIGVARAAFYPAISLSALGGFEDTGLSLASLPNGLWSVGTALALPVIDGGLRDAVLARSRAAYEQTRDNYRSVVLAGFGDVEDQLSRSRWLVEQVARYRVATKSALDGQNLALQLYTAGASDYLNVVVQEGYALTAQLSELQAVTAQLAASVDLVRALGGGWSVRYLPGDISVGLVSAGGAATPTSVPPGS